jgi:hypothetical protein
MKKNLNQMARTIIALHEQGYNDDFERYGTDQLWGSQEHRLYTFNEIQINKICTIKGHNGKAGKIIIAIETAGGCKGLFVDTSMDSFTKKFG